MTSKVRDLLDIPERVEKGQFQVTLTEGIARPAQTVGDYVVTPRIADAFDQALGTIDTALAEQRSVGTYLHGSFGSGKSHFMAMLSLLLADEEIAWRRPEFDRLRAKYAWVGKRQVVELHMHMLGKDSLEAAIYPAYLRFLATHHPSAPLPALFADEGLFENAADHLESLGDKRFFELLNGEESTARPAGRPAAGDWSFMGAAQNGAWDRTRFEAAIASQELETRQRLLDALLRTHFKAFRGSVSSYRELDDGLAIMAEHAKSLGYDAIVLFLDELILRLSYGAAEPRWLADMVQSMVKLVERTSGISAIPIVSFIARQRLLNEMVGDRLAGPEIALLGEQLGHSRGRFGTIELPNEELPEIISQRVLRPRDAAAKAEIDEAFAKLQRNAQAGSVRGGAWETLTAAHYDAEQFRKLYPFSPALVEALINLSGSLQRQRTAIKLLSELLVEHIGDLELGELVGVGDLFDLLAVGDDSADGIMRELFTRAKQLYRRKLLPVIQADNGTDTIERCQRMRDEHPKRLGCSGCAEKLCRNDNRMAKTLLVAALAPEGVLKDLTVAKLLELNHGKIKSKLPGQEGKRVSATIRKWANSIEEIHIGEGENPEVSVELQGVELKPIMAKAASVDSTSARVAELRRLLFDAMQIADGGGSETAVEQEVDWRQTRRRGQVRFGNVRLMGTEQLRCPDDHDWRLIIDFPFDEVDHGPHEDEAVVERFREDQPGTWTLVWLPSFFSGPVNRLLGDLVILNHILVTPDKYIAHLSVEQQEMALNLMRSQQSHKRHQVRLAMRKAYGIHPAGGDDDQLDSSRRIDKHLHLLTSEATLRPQIAPDLDKALDKYIEKLLDERYPRHPRFTRQLTPKTIERVLGHYDALLELGEGRLELDNKSLQELEGTLGKLGLVEVTETALRRKDDLVHELERGYAKHTQEPTAENVMHWLDPEGKAGLQPAVQALLVRALARATKRTLVESDGRPHEFRPGKPMSGAVILRKPELPTQVDWERALVLAGHAFGLNGRSLNPESLARFAAALDEKLGKPSDAALELPGALLRWYESLGLATNGADEAERRRLITAMSGRELITALRGHSPVEQVRALAGFTARTSPEALGRSTARARACLQVLESNLTLGVFEQLGRRGSSEAIDLLEQARKLLRQNELEAALADSMPRLAELGQRLLVEPASGSTSTPSPTPSGAARPPEPGWKQVADRSLDAEGREGARAMLARLNELIAELGEGGELRVRGHLTIERKED